VADTAQDAYTSMMRDRIAPALHEEGFRGSGQVFTLPSKSHFVLLGFQRRRVSDRQRVLFTVNVSAIDRIAWATAAAEKPALGDRPDANTFYGAWAAQARIGQLLPDPEGDKWWEVTPAASLDPLADDILGALTSYALPWLRAHLDESRPA
jgi:hypothetical protein